MYNLSKITQILNAGAYLSNAKTQIEYLVIDSRSIIVAEFSLFFALKGHRDGHKFIADAYKNNIRNFVVSDAKFVDKYSDCNFLLVSDVLASLQTLCTYHRKQFNLPTIGITGSNGKTMIKEWLYQLLTKDYQIIRSPKSYNSQIGVPLSVWNITEHHNLAIFEAGISNTQEMEKLEPMIQPTIGILTHMGDAHTEGFASNEEKLMEKLKLFVGVDLFIYAPEYVNHIALENLPGKKHFTWSTQRNADLQVVTVEPTQTGSHLSAFYLGEEIECNLPFQDRASIENGITCWATLLALGYAAEEVALRLAELNKVSMRLELKNGINHCSIIDDSYNADISSLAIALDFLNQQNQHEKRTLILSDLIETGKNEEDLYTEIADLLIQKNIHRLIGIGPHISKYAAKFKCQKDFYKSTDDFLSLFSEIEFENESILVKGARRFKFEQISKLLALKVHDTILEVDLNAMVHNLQYYRAKLKPNTKVMAMVKAFSYGSGSFEIANLLQFHKVDYLTVAYADEGIALRKAGITLPIMVMSPEESAFDAIIKYYLEPEIYSFDILKKFLLVLKDYKLSYPIHLKIDTGMHRLGFDLSEIPALAEFLSDKSTIAIKSIFSHLVGSDDEKLDEFSKNQFIKFNQAAAILIKALSYHPILHIANTSAINRFPNYHLDMVRLGIGLYGFDGSTAKESDLQTVMSLKTTVSQVKILGPGETVGYSRKGILPFGGKIATVKIGYADGYSRAFGYGVGKMKINGHEVPTIGSICMDMTMLDVSKVEVEEGDEVIVFNKDLTISDLALSIHTIPYEILTSVSQRVKRVYLHD